MAINTATKFEQVKIVVLTVVVDSPGKFPLQSLAHGLDAWRHGDFRVFIPHLGESLQCWEHFAQASAWYPTLDPEVSYPTSAIFQSMPTMRMRNTPEEWAEYKV